MKYERYIGTNPLEIVLIMGETFKVLRQGFRSVGTYSSNLDTDPGSKINPNEDPESRLNKMSHIAHKHKEQPLMLQKWPLRL